MYTHICILNLLKIILPMFSCLIVHGNLLVTTVVIDTEDTERDIWSILYM